MYSAVAGVDYGRLLDDEVMTSPSRAPRRRPQAAHSRLGKRSAFTTATWTAAGGRRLPTLSTAPAPAILRA